jgi:hypothetical protein
LQPGYLAVETHPDHAGFIRLLLFRQLPSAGVADHDGGRLRFAARFNDSEAALMHTHEILRRSLVDPDARLYRVSLARAIAAIESLGLSHRDVYLDPDLDAATRRDMASERAILEARRRRNDRIFEILGYIGIGILLFNTLFLSLG